MSARFLTVVLERAFNMRDGFGREIDYMRISVIDSCNLNCYYCNPCDNNEHCHALNILSVKEVLCIVRAATRLGIKHFRLTGGEPLLHPQLDEMVLQIKKISGVAELPMNCLNQTYSDTKFRKNVILCRAVIRNFPFVISRINFFCFFSIYTARFSLQF